MKKQLFVSLFLASLTACELQPAPKQAPPPAGSATVAPAGSAAVIEGSAAGAGSDVAAPPRRPLPPPPPPIQVTADCQKTGIKVAELMISDAEPSQKPAIERERTDIVRATEEACTRLGWTPSALACIAQSKTSNDVHACLAKFPPPGAGSGSGSPPRPHPHRSAKGRS